MNAMMEGMLRGILLVRGPMTVNDLAEVINRTTTADVELARRRACTYIRKLEDMGMVHEVAQLRDAKGKVHGIWVLTPEGARI